jgi:hypothetical protein
MKCPVSEDLFCPLIRWLEWEFFVPLCFEIFAEDKAISVLAGTDWFSLLVQKLNAEFNELPFLNPTINDQLPT